MAVNLPIDVRALYAAGKRLKADRELPVRIAVLVEIDAPDALVEAARAMLQPTSASGIVDVAVIEPDTLLRVDPRADAAILLAGSGAHLEASLRDLRSRAIPTAVLALRGDGPEFARVIEHPAADVLVGDDPAQLFAGPLADWAMARLEKLRIPLGHNFEFVRRAVAKEAVRHCAMQNAVVGAVMFIPGADMPIMTLNQGRMLLQIAAAYGQPLDRARIKELAAVVAGGLAFRTFAREVVGLVPGFGWAIKGGIAYSGTLAMGMTAIAYFEKGADLPGVARALAESAAETASHLTGRLSGSRPSGASSAFAPTGTADVRPVTDAGAAPVDTFDVVGQPTLIDAPPVQPTFVVLEGTDPLGASTGPVL